MLRMSRLKNPLPRGKGEVNFWGGHLFPSSLATGG